VEELLPLLGGCQEEEFSWLCLSPPKKYGFPSIYSVGDFTAVIGSNPFNPRDIDNLYIDFLRTHKSIESWLG
jgi:hypothetical protein